MRHLMQCAGAVLRAHSAAMHCRRAAGNITGVTYRHDECDLKHSRNIRTMAVLCCYA